MKSYIYFLLAFVLLFAGACNSVPTEPAEMTEAQYLASVDQSIRDYLDAEFGTMNGRTAQFWEDGWEDLYTLSDYTDMTCEVPGGYAGSLPAYFSVELNRTLNGDDWVEWKHPYYPWITAQYMFIWIMDWFHKDMGCDGMTYIVGYGEVEQGVDWPNVDEVEWPVF